MEVGYGEWRKRDGVLGNSWVSGLSKWMDSFAIFRKEDTEDRRVGVRRKIMNLVWDTWSLIGPYDIQMMSSRQVDIQA